MAHPQPTRKSETLALHQPPLVLFAAATLIFLPNAIGCLAPQLSPPCSKKKSLIAPCSARARALHSVPRPCLQAMGSSSSSQSKGASGSGARDNKGGAAVAPSSSERDSRAPRAKGTAATKDCGDCGHCKFMKAGPCREQYVQALDCVKDDHKAHHLRIMIVLQTREKPAGSCRGAIGKEGKFPAVTYRA